MSQANFGPYLECSLDVAVDLANSFDPEGVRDDLPDPAALATFLEEHKVRSPRRPTGADLAHVRGLRRRLRDVFEARDQEAAVETLNRLLSETGARPELTNHDGEPWHLHYTPPGTPLAPRLAAESAMALSVVIAEKGFDRLRVCDGERCSDVFVDASRNRSRRFCSPEVCGNRSSVAAYRARRRESREAAPAQPGR
jgi:predicted RNA-binding Zn ribbon-like protein